MNISAILVTTIPENTAHMIDQLNCRSGVEVYHSDPETGKIIIIQEAEMIHDEVDGLKNIKKMPGIIMAEMVEHYFGDDANLYPSSDLENIDQTCGTTMDNNSCVPEFLNQ